MCFLNTSVLVFDIIAYQLMFINWNYSVKKILVVEENTTVTRALLIDDPDICLKIERLSSSMCLLARGHVGFVPFLSICYWDGLSTEFDKLAPNAARYARDNIAIVIANYASDVLSHMRVFNPLQLKPHLDMFCVVGGERATEDLSGTELEVETFRQHAQKLCQKFFITSDETTYDVKSYMTQGVQTMNVTFSKEHLILVDADTGEEFDESMDNRLASLFV
jgi:hypothetical protein